MDSFKNKLGALSALSPMGSHEDSKELLWRSSRAHLYSHTFSVDELEEEYYDKEELERTIQSDRESLKNIDKYQSSKTMHVLGNTSKSKA